MKGKVSIRTLWDRTNCLTSRVNVAITVKVRANTSFTKIFQAAEVWAFFDGFWLQFFWLIGGARVQRKSLAKNRVRLRVASSLPSTNGRQSRTNH